MKNTVGRRKLCIALLMLNIIFIWGNSLLPGSASGALSDWVRNVLAILFSSGQDTPVVGGGLLRKLAHFTEFACLGGLLTWLFTMLGHPRIFAPVGGFIVACVDETIQRFVPDRGPGFSDVLLDTAGALLGMSLLLIGYTIHRKWKNTIMEEKSL